MSDKKYWCGFYTGTFKYLCVCVRMSVHVSAWCVFLCARVCAVAHACAVAYACAVAHACACFFTDARACACVRCVCVRVRLYGCACGCRDLWTVGYF